MKTVAVTPLVEANLEALSRAAAAHVLALANQRIVASGRFSLALAGGSTPKRLYELLASPEFACQTDWSAWQVYFGDERCVVHDHADSNYRMAREALLAHVPIPPAQVHPMVRDPETPDADATAYAADLANQLDQAGGIPVFDLVLLGMGDDGHTASLFPGTEILDVTDRAVATVYVPAKASWRISLTFPGLEQARELLVLVAGAATAPVLARVLGQPEAPAHYPVERIAARGTVNWMLDEAAAKELKAC